MRETFEVGGIFAHALLVRSAPGTPLQHSFTRFSAIALVLLAGARAEAEKNEDGEVITIIGETEESQAGFSTEIRTEEFAGETTSVAEVLGRSVGVNVRSLGGLGGFSSISVRGSASSHTAMFVDGIPISKLGTASQDLGAFELQSFSELEIYRGAVPVRLGGAAMGGAVEFRSMAGQPTGNILLSSGLGSFGARHLIAQTHDAVGNWAYMASIGYRGADGDYRYFNDNGTLLVAEDDAFEARENNGFDMVHAAARLRTTRGRTTFEGGSRTTLKRQGIPGLASVQSTTSTLDGLSELADLGVRYRKPGLALGGKGYLYLDRQEYRDLDGEVGLGNQHNRYRTTSAGTMGTAEALLGSAHLLKTGLELGIEHVQSRDFLDEMATPVSAWRGSTGITAADEILLGNTRITPMVRLDLQRTSAGLDWDPIVVTDNTEARFEYFVSPRVTASHTLGMFELKASAGRYFRAPTATELFGDRGFIVGNPELLAETGTSADIGFVQLWQSAPWPIRELYFQGALFGARQSNAIVMLPTAGGAALSQNLGDADIYGAESALHCAFRGGVALSANYTRIGSRQVNTLASYEGKALPGRPKHQFYGRLRYRPRHLQRLSGFTDLAYASGNFLDAANRNEVPQRLLLGAGLTVALWDTFTAGIALKNALDQRVEDITLSPAPRPDLQSVPRAVSDFMGYPLPGRSLYFTLNATL